MGSSIEGKLDKAALDKWEYVFKTSELGRMNIPEEMLEAFKACSLMMFEEGQVNVISSMREIFNNDPCLFEEFFCQDEDGTTH